MRSTGTPGGGAGRHDMTRTGLEGGKDWTAWHAAYDEESPRVTDWSRSNGVSGRRSRAPRRHHRCRQRVRRRGTGPGRRRGISEVTPFRAARRARSGTASRAAPTRQVGSPWSCADAGLSDHTWAPCQPASSQCGVFGNITDQDVERTVQALPMPAGRRDGRIGPAIVGSPTDQRDPQTSGTPIRRVVRRSANSVDWRRRSSLSRGDRWGRFFDVVGEG